MSDVTDQICGPKDLTALLKVMRLPPSPPEWRPQEDSQVPGFPHLPMRTSKRIYYLSAMYLAQDENSNTTAIMKFRILSPAVNLHLQSTIHPVGRKQSLHPFASNQAFIWLSEVHSFKRENVKTNEKLRTRKKQIRGAGWGMLWEIQIQG